MKTFTTTAIAATLIQSCLYGANVTLEWDPNPETDIAGYRISYGLSPYTLTETKSTGNVTKYTLNNLLDNVTYYFTIRALNIKGFESDPHPIISHTTYTSTVICRSSTADQEHPVENAIDNNPASLFASQWKPTEPVEDQWIELEFSEPKWVTGLKYLPRQDGQPNGIITDYQVIIDDKPVVSGVMSTSADEKTIVFSKREARTIRLMSKLKHITCSELKDIAADPPSVDVLLDKSDNLTKWDNVFKIGLVKQKSQFYRLGVNAGNQPLNVMYKLVQVSP